VDEDALVDVGVEDEAELEAEVDEPDDVVCASVAREAKSWLIADLKS
jgi:hypothetical protein